LKSGFVGFVGKAMGEVVYVLQINIGRFEAVADGVDRERAGGFLAGKPFFGSRGQNALMSYQCRRGIKSLRYVIFPTG
jgi:hypothetical protein